jgi:hypothetical protein
VKLQSMNKYVKIDQKKAVQLYDQTELYYQVIELKSSIVTGYEKMKYMLAA